MPQEKIMKKKTIIHIASEVVPYSKAGGLGDIVGTLPNKIVEYDSDYKCIVFTPYYKSMKNTNISSLGHYNVEFNNINYDYTVYYAVSNEVVYYFIQMDYVFSLDNIYVDGSKPYLVDVGLEYFYFAKCIIDFIKMNRIIPDIWITHDWHAAGIYGYIKKCHSLHIIHNYNHQGQLYYDIIPFMEDDIRKVAEEIVNDTGYLSMNAFAIKMAEKIVTVSPTYANELNNKIISHPGLDLFDIYHKEVIGILNGVDYRKWSPEYTIDDVMKKKLLQKQMIKEQLQIHTGKNRPLLLVMSRLTQQKGIDYFINLHNRFEFDIYDRLKQIISIGFDIIICGVPAGGIGGEVDSQLKSLVRKYANNFVYLNHYSDKIAHQLLMGTDFLLHLSNYEPCGLTPMYAMKYGVIPIVSNTGGLHDIVIDGLNNDNECNGFVVNEMKFENIEQCLENIKCIFDDVKKIKKIRLQCMKQDFGWDKSIQKYCEIMDSMF